MAEHAIEFPGDSRHPEHADFIAELGRATYQAIRVAGIAFDILRVFGGRRSAELYSDPLGRLCTKLAVLQRSNPNLPGLDPFLTNIQKARDTRNDLLHALPVLHGLHRRRSADPSYVRNFFTVDDLRSVTAELDAVHREGSRLLYHDDGKGVKAWYEAGGS